MQITTKVSSAADSFKSKVNTAFLDYIGVRYKTLKSLHTSQKCATTDLKQAVTPWRSSKFNYTRKSHDKAALVSEFSETSPELIEIDQELSKAADNLKETKKACKDAIVQLGEQGSEDLKEANHILEEGEHVASVRLSQIAKDSTGLRDEVHDVLTQFRKATIEQIEKTGKECLSVCNTDAEESYVQEETKKAYDAFLKKHEILCQWAAEELQDQNLKRAKEALSLLVSTPDMSPLIIEKTLPILRDKLYTSQLCDCVEAQYEKTMNESKQIMHKDAAEPADAMQKRQEVSRKAFVGGRLLRRFVHSVPGGSDDLFSKLTKDYKDTCTRWEEASLTSIETLSKKLESEIPVQLELVAEYIEGLSKIRDSQTSELI